MPPTSLTVAVLTFRRPDQVAELLPLLFGQIERLEREWAGQLEAEVLIVDNDPAASACDGMTQYVDRPDFRYVVEPRPGISAARNRVLDETTGRDVLVFLDDDERPSNDWLVLMVRTWRSTGSAAVAGAVRSTFDSPLDPWIQAGRFFDRRRLPTGTPIDLAATNNLLVDLHRVRDLGLRFDEEFGLSGGEDTLFTHALHASGAHMVWCNEAMVTDVVPTDRATRRWVLLRAVSSGNSIGRVRLRLAITTRQRMEARVGTAVEGAVRMTGGLARAAAGVPLRSVKLRATGLRTAARGVGMTSSVFGYVYNEYRR